MPTPTVSFVDSSMRMKLPVVRLRRYSSTNRGAVGPQAHAPDLVQPEPSALVAVQRVDVDTVAHSSTLASAVRVVCLMR